MIHLSAYYPTRNEQKFPVDKKRYTRVVGNLLPTMLESIFTELGFRVKTYYLQANGRDMEIFDGDTLVIAVEVLNWNIGSKLHPDRKSCIIRNLNKYNCNRLLVHTVPLTRTDGLEQNRIVCLGIGYQVLPQEYYDFFLNKEEVRHRRPNSEHVRTEIKSKIIQYLYENYYGIRYLKDLFY